MIREIAEETEAKGVDPRRAKLVIWLKTRSEEDRMYFLAVNGMMNFVDYHRRRRGGQKPEALVQLEEELLK